jgi:hypothetical protein
VMERLIFRSLNESKRDGCQRVRATEHDGTPYAL